MVSRLSLDHPWPLSGFYSTSTSAPDGMQLAQQHGQLRPLRGFIDMVFNIREPSAIVKMSKSADIEALFTV
jgi:hypothetical protein